MALSRALAVAHRGDPYHRRENTLPSVRSALLKGADAVEVDVRLTRDGVPVLLHDETLGRLWGRPEAVAAMCADELHKLTDGGVPSLADALGELAEHRSGRMMLDLTDPGQAAATVAAVRAAGAGERVYYCGGPAAMRALRAQDPAAEIALTWTTSARPLDALVAGVRPRWINLRFGLIDAALVRWAREHDLLVSAWTPDWQRSMSRLLDLGVDSLTSNRLDALQRVLARRRG